MTLAFSGDSSELPDDHAAPHSHGPGDSIEWEDDMLAINRETDTTNMIWQLIDRETGATNEDISWKFTVGDRVKIRLVNEKDSDHPMPHPFHIHGAGRFLVLSKDGVTEPNLAWKDTVLVLAGQTVDILLQVTNPGRWMSHCHIAEHNQSGMMFSFDVAPPSSRRGRMTAASSTRGEPQTPSDHRAVIFADLAGYTALTEAHGDSGAADVAERFFELTASVLQADARIVKTIGDAVMVVASDCGRRTRDRAQRAACRRTRAALPRCPSRGSLRPHRGTERRHLRSDRECRCPFERTRSRRATADDLHRRDALRRPRSPHDDRARSHVAEEHR